MGLNKIALKAGIRDICDDLYDNPDNYTPEECREIFATRLSDLIDDFIKSGDGVYQTASLTAGANVVTPSGPVAIKIT